MHPQVSVPRDGIAVAHGYGLKIYVERRNLVVHDGICDERATRRYHRVTSKLHRLVIVGRTGFITLDAIRWLKDARAALLHIDADGELLSTSIASGLDLAALRRAQALAAINPAGTEIARAVLAAKVAGQRAILDELPYSSNNAAERVDAALADIAQATTIRELVFAESQAAEAYWDAWSSLRIPFAARDADRRS
jgi:CRISPR/Cas system-associated endonuclease Cas1